MIDVGWAGPEDRETLAAFMVQVFPRARWGLPAWQRLLDGRWSRPGDSYAITAYDGETLIGAMALVVTQRPTEGGEGITANMSSWYILKPWRGQGLGGRMIALARSIPGVTITDLTSSPLAIGAVRRAGLEVLDDTRMIWEPRKNLHPLAVSDPADRLGDLTPKDSRIIRDLDGLAAQRVVVETPDGPVLIILSVKRKHDSHLTHEVLHIGNRARFAAHARAIADALLPADGAVLSVDRRFVPDDADSGEDRQEAIRVPRFYTPGRMDPADIDYLYSEVVLLDMKLG